MRARPARLAIGYAIVALAAALILGGCQNIPFYGAAKTAVVGSTYGGIQERMDFNDLQRDFTKAALCDLAGGSVGRDDDEAFKRWWVERCVGIETNGITMDDIEAAAKIMKIIEPAVPTQP
jgi:hypothetical protein